MVAELTQGRAKYADHADLCEAAAPAARTLSDEFLRLADEDAAAYAACAIALKLPRESFTDQELRERQIRETATVAAEVPLKVVERCVEALGIAESLAGRSNKNASSDLRVASLLLEAAADGAAENVIVNLPLIGSNDWTDATAIRVEDLLQAARRIASTVREVVGSGDSREPLKDVPSWPSPVSAR
jgi:formiminotetrahydrofolate cyclodeaminase